MEKGNSELIQAIEELEKERQISKEVLFEAIEDGILKACKEQYSGKNGKNEDDKLKSAESDVVVRVKIDRETGAVSAYADITVVDEVTKPQSEITPEAAAARYPGKKYIAGDVISVEVNPANFGRIAAQAAKQAVVQKIREEEKTILYNKYKDMEKLVVSGVVQRFLGKNVSIHLGKCDGILSESEQIKGEKLRIGQRIKVYVVEVEQGNKGPKITLSRTHPDLVKRLFESEVTEIASGSVEIMALSREAGARTKMAVRSNEQGIDPIGACIGPNGMRVNAIVDELGGEKIDIIAWNDNPELLIKNALSPAKADSVLLDPDMSVKSARVVVPDSQLSLAIGREGQNARLAARITGYKIDIKSESQVEAEEAAYDEDDFVEEDLAEEVIAEADTEEAVAEDSEKTEE